MVVVAVEACGQFHEAAVGQENGVVADAQNLVAWDGGCVGDFRVIVSRLVGLFRPCRNGRVGFGIAGDVARIVGESTHIGGDGVFGDVVRVVVKGANVVGDIRNDGFVGQIIPTAGEAFHRGQFHEAAAGQINCVVADGQHLLFGEGGQVAGIIGESTHIGGQ